MSEHTDLLLDLSGEPMCWDKNKRHPSSLLRGLARQGFIEVETHAVSPWTFGPPHPGWFRGHKNSPEAVAWESENQAYQDFRRKHPSTWRMRSEVHAKITDMGIEYLKGLGLLN